MKAVKGQISAALRKREAALREIGLSYPEAYEEFPWGQRAIKVKKKIFFTVNADPEGLGLTLKLPNSGKEALLLPFTEPTHYGMGKYGWVTARFGPKEEPPMFLIRDWIEESFRAVAPKTMVKLLDGDAAPKKKVAKKKAAQKKPVAKKKVAKKPATRKKKATKKR